MRLLVDATWGLAGSRSSHRDGEIQASHKRLRAWKPAH